MAIPFCKFHGFGNDYIVIERDALHGDISLPELAKAICHRHTGVGADGIALLEKLDAARADYFCEIVNPDGSTAGFSGNGTRCAVAYLHYSGIWSATRLRLETRSGVKVYDLIEQKNENEFWFTAEIGKPLFASDLVPVTLPIKQKAVVNEPIEIDGRVYQFSAVNVGNPVACVFCDEFEVGWPNLGSMMETHEMFPDRANIVFVRIIDRDNIDVRIWERGAGETSASGTCASGAAVLSAFMLKTGRSVSVHAPGGITKILWRNDDELVITGRADFAFRGEWPL
jgi:diaminopimelate epimerase